MSESVTQPDTVSVDSVAVDTAPADGPVTHPETGTITHYGPHSTVVVHHGGKIVRLTHGESFTPARDGEPAVILRNITKES